MNPSLASRVEAFSAHLTQMVDGLPESRQALLPTRQAYFSTQAMAEHVARAASARSVSSYRAALDHALLEVREANHWLAALIDGQPETARLCTPLHDEAAALAELLVDEAY